MNRLVYQYWDGNPTSEVRASVASMKEYAERIGATHLYEQSPRWVQNLGKYSPHYGQFKVVFDESFSKYDQILFTDCDVFPVVNLEENIFDELDGHDIGICEEWQQVEVRKKHTVAGINHINDNYWASVVKSKWGVEVPRADCGSVRAFNSGVVVWNRSGIERARTRFVKFEDYVNEIVMRGLPSFYTCDQPYLHAMIFKAKMNVVELDYKWNSSVHYVPGTKGDVRPVNDLRDNPNLVHVQLSGADKLTDGQLYKVVNLPVEEWNL